MAADMQTIPEIMAEVTATMCDKYCKYPTMTPPEGKDEGWLLEEGSPCEECPLNRLT